MFGLHTVHAHLRLSVGLFLDQRFQCLQGSQPLCASSVSSPAAATAAAGIDHVSVCNRLVDAGYQYALQSELNISPEAWAATR
jgi:hypothetical protein